MPVYHSVYGLGLHANQPIPGLVVLPARPRVDVEVWLGLMPRWVETYQANEEQRYISPYQWENGEPNLRVGKLIGGAYFHMKYADGTRFLVNCEGTRVWATWPDQLTLEDTATYLLGPVLGFVLRLRGVTCLHASAVVLGEMAIALLGWAGAGKSTTAAAFARRGYPVLSDDVVALSEDGQHFVAQPGYPLVRLWPESVNTLFGSADLLPRLTPTWDKRYLDLTDNGYRFQGESLPLTAIYVLDERCADSAAPFIEAMPASTGLMKLVANTYTTYLLDSVMRGQEFESLGRLMASVPLRRVLPHTDPAYLSKLCDVILDDCRALSVRPLTYSKQGSCV